MASAKVAFVIGSDSDLPHVKPGLEMLREMGVSFDLRVISAHRTPKIAHEFAASAAGSGYHVIIAAAGGAAHLAGVMASLTTLPVIGVPMPTELGGADSLYSTVQMPAGVPVATMAIGAAGAKNAAILAAQILALSDEGLRKKLADYKKKLAAEVQEKDARIQKEIGGGKVGF
jgi:5-(carboxyamino)imidazole ribonucleotide mutase